MFEPAEKRPFDSQDSPLPVDEQQRQGCLGMAVAVILMGILAFGLDVLVKALQLRTLP